VTPPEYIRSYTYHYVPRAEIAAYERGDRRAACVVQSAPWDGSDVHGDSYVILGVSVSEYCSACKGAGKVADKRRKRTRFATVTCKSCKGSPERDVTPTVARSPRAV
jgi:hypothetical protein